MPAVHTFVTQCCCCFAGDIYAKVDSNAPQSKHNKGQYLAAHNVTLAINMTHLASEIQGYLEAWCGAGAWWKSGDACNWASLVVQQARADNNTHVVWHRAGVGHGRTY